MSGITNIVVISVTVIICALILFFAFIRDKNVMINVNVRNITPLTFNLNSSNGNVKVIAPNESYNVTLDGVKAFVKATAETPTGPNLIFEKRMNFPCNSAKDLYLSLDGFVEGDQVYPNITFENTGDVDVYFSYVTRIGQRRFLFQPVSVGAHIPGIYVPQNSTWQIVAATDYETPLAQVTVTQPLHTMNFDGHQLIVS